MNSRRRAVPALLAAILFAAAMVPTTDAHAAWTSPRCRGTYNTNALKLPDMGVKGVPKDDCPHCLNGGGKGSVMAAAKNNWVPWEPMDKTKPFRHDSGLCGDPEKNPSPRAHEKAGTFGPPKGMPYAATYKAGQEVGFQIDVHTHHNGFFEFFICNVDKCGGDISEKCFKGGHCRQLMRAEVPECESKKSMHCSPIDPDYPGRWIMPCRVGAHVGEHFMGGAGADKGKYMKYKLPEGFACQNCVMQWYWASANSCNPPGFKEYFDKYPMEAWGECPGDGGAKGARNPNLATCGGPTFPEEFWNCADVRVNANGAAGDAPTSGASEEEDDDAAGAAAEQRPEAEEKPAEEPTPAEEQKPVEEPNPVEGQPPADQPAAEQQPAEQQPAEQQPVEQQPPAEQRPQEQNEPELDTPPMLQNRPDQNAQTTNQNAGQQNQNQGPTDEQRRVQQEQEEVRRKQQEEVMRKRALSKQNSQQPQQSSQQQEQQPQQPQQPEQPQQPQQPQQTEPPQQPQSQEITPDSQTLSAGEGTGNGDYPMTGRESGAAGKGDCTLNSSSRASSFSGAKCASNWRQCGGARYAGPTHCCSPHFECVAVGSSFAMCKKAAHLAL